LNTNPSLSGGRWSEVVCCAAACLCVTYDASPFHRNWADIKRTRSV